MTFDPIQARRYAAFVLPVVIVALGWAVVVRPTSAESAQLTLELQGLRGRIASVRSEAGAPPAAEPAGDPMQAFERQVAVGDATGRLLEELSRLARTANVRVETIETSDQQKAVFAGGPGVAGGTVVDPRLSLFGVPLTYSPVTMVADADYASLGAFLWELRNLSTVIEVRSVVLSVPVEQTDALAPPRGTVHATVTMFAYARPAPPKAEGGR